MNILKKYFNSLKEKYSQKSLFYAFTTFLSLLLVLFGSFGIISYQLLKQSEETRIHKERTCLLLSTALDAQTLAGTRNQDFSSAQFETSLPKDCLQLWIKDASNKIVYFTDQSSLQLLDNIFEKSPHCDLPEIHGDYTASKNYVFYSIPLSGGCTLQFAFPNAPGGLSPYQALFGGVILSLVLSAALLFWYFTRRVYQPLIKIEHAINMEEDGELTFDLSFSENSDLYPLADKLNRMFEHIKNLLNQKYSLDLLYKQAEINALQSQINPHFLYNTLDSIRGLALMQNSLEIANLLKSLSNIFRYSISNKQDVVTLTEELNHLNNYLTIQQYRFQDKFEFVTEFDEPPERFLTCQIPKLTVQPIVENAIFHGLETKRGRGIIHFYIYRTASRLIIEIKDNGNGMDDETLRRLNEKLNSPADPNASPVGAHRSIALQNVNQRIQLSYGDDYGLTIFSTLSVGTTVQIQLPYLPSCQDAKTPQNP